ncbi:hypothetical protein ACKWTF_012973 [Chironomus riparius]
MDLTNNLNCLIIAYCYCIVASLALQQAINLNIKNPKFKNLIKQIPNVKQNLYQSAIIFADDIADLDEMCENLVLANHYQKPLIFIIVFMNAVEKNIQLQSGPNYLNQDSSSIHLYSYLIFYDISDIDLVSLEWFSKSTCNQLHLTIVNSFIIKEYQWTKTLKYQRKFINLWNCMITLNADLSDHLSMNVYNEKVTGLVPQFMRLMAVFGNFTLNFQIKNPNGVLDVRSRRIIDPTIYMRLGIYSKFTSGKVHFGSTFIPSEHSFYVTPGELYTSYEKLFLPFDHATWLFILITFSTTFVIIFLVVNFLPSSIQKRIYGVNAQSPALDIVQTFFGISQTKSPIENAPRIILIFFLFFCLVIRTAYQGVSFDFLTTEMRKKPIDSIEKLVIKNFTIVTVKSAGYALDDNIYTMIGEDRRNHIIWKTDLEIVDFYRNNIKNASAKLAFYMQDTFFDVLHCLTKGTQGVYLKQILFSYPIGFGTFQNHFMTVLIEETLQLIIPAGIPQFLFEYYHWLSYRKNFVKPKIGPNVLCMNDLLFGFVLWAAACGISAAIFCAEVIGRWLKDKTRKYVGFITFVNIFEQGLLRSH